MLDVLVIAPHPDDAELGWRARSCTESHGLRVGILDLTNGEPTPHRLARNPCPRNGRRQRRAGARLARESGPAEPQSGGDARSPAQLAGVFRQQRPRWLFAPYWVDAHPDHAAATELIEAARFWSKLTKSDLPGEPHHPERIFYYYCVHSAACCAAGVRAGYQPLLATQSRRHRAAIKASSSRAGRRSRRLLRSHARPGRILGLVDRHASMASPSPAANRSASAG